MKTLSAHGITRRDRCFLISRRANKLTQPQAAAAWFAVAAHLETLSEKDVPKFNELLAGIRAAIKVGRTLVPNP